MSSRHGPLLPSFFRCRNYCDWYRAYARFGDPAYSKSRGKRPTSRGFVIFFGLVWYRTADRVFPNTCILNVGITRDRGTESALQKINEGSIAGVYHAGALLEGNSGRSPKSLVILFAAIISKLPHDIILLLDLTSTQEPFLPIVEEHNQLERKNYSGICGCIGMGGLKNQGRPPHAPSSMRSRWVPERANLVKVPWKRGPTCGWLLLRFRPSPSKGRSLLIFCLQFRRNVIGSHFCDTPHRKDRYSGDSNHNTVL